MSTGLAHKEDELSPEEYRAKLKKELEDSLEEDEIICNKCDGTGTDPDYDSPWLVCPKCQGQKKLDWIQAATGVAPNDNAGSHSSSFSSASFGTSGLYSTGGYIQNVIPSCQMQGIGSHTHGPIQPGHLHIDECRIRDKPVTDYIQEVMIKMISEAIDEKIMSCFKKAMEQNKNKKTDWEGIFW